MAAKALLDKNPEPTREEIDYALDGNLCRCGGYPKIIEAIWQAGLEMKKDQELKDIADESVELSESVSTNQPQISI
jgi:xanthine dehydrogenase iron-sulfur cluster and FAD-binding subunit A